MSSIIEIQNKLRDKEIQDEAKAKIQDTLETQKTIVNQYQLLYGVEGKAKAKKFLHDELYRLMLKLIFTTMSEDETLKTITLANAVCNEYDKFF